MTNISEAVAEKNPAPQMHGSGHDVKVIDHQQNPPKGPNPPKQEARPGGYNKYQGGFHRRPRFNKKNKGGDFNQKPQGDNRLRIIPLGGLEEVGKNIMAFEYGNDIIVVDCGMSFAGPDMLGVDYIVPDVSYLAERKRNVRGVIFTHGHLDHIGAVQYIIPQLGNPQLYATKLTAGLIRNRLREFGLDKSARIQEFTESTVLKLGAFEVERFQRIAVAEWLRRIMRHRPQRSGQRPSPSIASSGAPRGQICSSVRTQAAGPIR